MAALLGHRLLLDAVHPRGLVLSEGPYLSSAEMPARRGNVPSLDGLRALSVTLVLVSHFVSATIFPGGLGVYVFFIISGFLITRLLLSERKAVGTISLGQFYARRLLRLYPVIIVYTVIVVVLSFFVLGRPFNPAEPLSALFYFANFWYSIRELHGQTAGLPFAIFWSLSVEEHFYILFPFALVLMRGDPRRLAIAMMAVCAISLGLRLMVAFLHPEYLSSLVFYYQSEFRLDSIAFGVLLAAACETAAGRRLLGRLTHPSVFIAAIAGVGLCLAIRDPWFRETVRYTLEGVCLTVLVASVLFTNRYWPANILLNTAVMIWIGRLSYSLYVWHLGVSYFIEALGLPQRQEMLVDFVFSILVAVSSYYIIEQPFLTLRHRFGSQARA